MKWIIFLETLNQLWRLNSTKYSFSCSRDPQHFTFEAFGRSQGSIRDLRPPDIPNIPPPVWDRYPCSSWFPKFRFFGKDTMLDCLYFVFMHTAKSSLNQEKNERKGEIHSPLPSPWKPCLSMTATELFYKRTLHPTTRKETKHSNWFALSCSHYGSPCFYSHSSYQFSCQSIATSATFAILYCSLLSLLYIIIVIS